jgi:hypothetical protein
MLDLHSKWEIKGRARGTQSQARPNIEYQLATEADENGPPKAAQLFRAHEQRRVVERETALRGMAKSAGLQPSQWQSLGPANVAGRIRTIAFDSRNARRVFVGAATGGLWISEDAGGSWRAYSDFLPNLSITTLVVDAQNPDTMYLGTGEASQGFVGVGAFKSTDGGATWQYLVNTNPDLNPDWRFVNRLALHPSQPGLVLAGVTNNDFVSGAIYRSTNGGETWARAADMKALDIAFEPGNPANAVAGLDDGTIAYSRDAGASWSRTSPLVASPSGRSKTARAEVAFARSQPGVVYASVDNAKGEVWRSADSGATWVLQSTPAHLNDQGDYDNTIWVSPLDSGHVVVGGLELYQSFDGGVTFARISERQLAPASPHADHHALVSPPDFGPANQALFNGNDGGVYKIANVRTATPAGQWVNANNGLNVTQFYSGAGRTAAGGRITGGTQDNGSLVLSQGLWRTWEGGDGSATAVDPTSDQTIYGSLYYLAISARPAAASRAPTSAAASPRPTSPIPVANAIAARRPRSAPTSSRRSCSTRTMPTASSRAAIRSGCRTTCAAWLPPGARSRRHPRRRTTTSTRSRCRKATATWCGWDTTTARSTAALTRWPARPRGHAWGRAASRGESCGGSSSTATTPTASSWP